MHLNRHGLWFSTLIICIKIIYYTVVLEVYKYIKLIITLLLRQFIKSDMLNGYNYETLKIYGQLSGACKTNCDCRRKQICLLCSGVTVSSVQHVYLFMGFKKEGLGTGWTLGHCGCPQRSITGR